MADEAGVADETKAKEAIVVDEANSANKTN